MQTCVLQLEDWPVLDRTLNKPALEPSHRSHAPRASSHALSVSRSLCLLIRYCRYFH